MTRRGFTLVEAVLAALVVGVALAGALQAAAVARVGRLKLAERAEGVMLAQDLLTEVMVLPFDDPDGASGKIGAETGELDRTDYDDIDDYNGLTDDPPTDRGGTQLTTIDGFVRTVGVTWVDLSTLATSSSETQTKRADVVVTRNGREVARLAAFAGSGVRGSSTSGVTLLDGATAVTIK